MSCVGVQRAQCSSSIRSIVAISWFIAPPGGVN